MSKTAVIKEYSKTLITPATLQKALAEARGRLEDEDIFLSPAYHQQVNSLGKYLVGRTGRKDIALAARIIFERYTKADYVAEAIGLTRTITAFTDNKIVVVNAGHPEIQDQLRRSDRHYCVMGMCCHEFAHCLFTDFTLLEKQYKKFMRGGLYPRKPKETPANEHGLKGVGELMTKGKKAREKIAMIYKSLDNAIEDGYIERSLTALHPGDAKKAINMLNKAFFGGNFMDKVKKGFADDPDYFNVPWTIFSNALLTLLKTGAVDIDPGFHPCLADINGRIAALAPRVMRELENSNVMSRKELCLDIILENWDLLETQAEAQAQQQGSGSSGEGGGSGEGGMSGLSDDELSKILGDIISSILENIGADHDGHPDSNGGRPIKVFIELPSPSQEAGGNGGQNGESVEESEGGSGGSGEDGESGQEGEDGSGGSGEDGESGQEGEDGSDGSGQKGGSEQDGKGESGGSGQKGESGQEGAGNPGGSGQEGEDGTGSAGNKPGETESGPSGGQPQGVGGGIPTRGTAAASNTGETVTIRIVPENEQSGSDGSFGKTLNSIENDMARTTAEEQVEEALRETLQQNAGASATNDRWNIDIYRSAAPPEAGMQRHDSVWRKIAPISKTLKKELLKILRDRRTGTKLTGLIYGRRVDSRSLYRTDEKYFSKNRLPNDKPTVATALLIDQSGSMACGAYDSSGLNLFSNKIQAASNAALILYDFCTELGFPIMVAGHTTGRHGTVMMDVMASFQKKDKGDRYRICAAHAAGGNRDGTALNYMLSELEKRPEEIKLLFIVSDGLPSDYGAGEDGVKHLQEVLAKANKAGVLTFAAALNEDINSIKGIYGEDMFEITDLARMPRTLLNVMKRYVK